MMCVLVEFTSRRFYHHSTFHFCFENIADPVSKFLWGLGVDEHIIYIHDTTHIDVFQKDHVDLSQECSWCIA